MRGWTCARCVTRASRERRCRKSAAGPGARCSAATSRIRVRGNIRRRFNSTRACPMTGRRFQTSWASATSLIKSPRSREPTGGADQNRSTKRAGCSARAGEASSVASPTRVTEQAAPAPEIESPAPEKPVETPPPATDRSAQIAAADRKKRAAAAKEKEERVRSAERQAADDLAAFKSLTPATSLRTVRWSGWVK